MRGRLLRVALALTIVGAGSAAAVVLRSDDAEAVTLAPGQRAITVVGAGSAKVQVDSSTWSLGVLTTGADAEAALRQNNRAIAKVIAAMREAGVAAADLRTESVSVYPTYGGQTGAEVAGFQVTNSVSVTVRDVRRAAKLVSVAAQAGANQIYGPNLATASNEAAYQSALEAALNQARAKAGFVAGKAGVTVGAILDLTEGSVTGGFFAPAPAEAAAAEPAPVPLAPGQQEIQAQVTVTFAVS